MTGKPFEPVNPAKLGEIINAAGKEPKGGADQLLSDLEGAASIYWTAAEAKPSRAKQTAAEIGEMVAKAKELRDWAHDDIRLVKHVPALSRLIEEAQALTAMPEALGAVLGLGERNAIENLIGTLAIIYGDHFGERAGYRRKYETDEMLGTFVAFAREALAAMSVPRSDNYIAASITKWNARH